MLSRIRPREGAFMKYKRQVRELLVGALAGIYVEGEPGVTSLIMELEKIEAGLDIYPIEGDPIAEFFFKFEMNTESPYTKANLFKLMQYLAIKQHLISIADGIDLHTKLRRIAEIETGVASLSSKEEAPESVASVFKAAKASGKTEAEVIKIIAEEFRERAVLTAHPTESSSDDLLEVLRSLREFLDAASDVTKVDKKEIRKRIEKLLEVSLTPDHKAKPEEEIARNIKYLKKLQSYLGEFFKRIELAFKHYYPDGDLSALKSAMKRMVQVRCWTGGDADGNEKITAEQMQLAVSMYEEAGIDPSLAAIDVRQNMPVNSKAIADILEETFKFLETKTTKTDAEEALFIKLRDVNYREFVSVKSDDSAIQLDKDKARYSELNDLLGDPIIFGFIKELYDDEGFKERCPIAVRELARMEMIGKYPKVFRNYIISNTEGPSNFLEVIFLAKVFGANPNIVPLFESKRTLGKADHTMGVILQNPHYKDFKGEREQKIMVGYSDSQRESGVSVLPWLYDAIQRVRLVVEKAGVKLSVFHGNGLDTGRGGPGVIKPEQTVQGNHIRYIFMITSDALRYLGRVFSVTMMELLGLVPDKVESPLLSELGIETQFQLNEKLKQVSVIGCKMFEGLFAEDGYSKALENYLTYASPFWLFVKTCNFSSRSSKRDIVDVAENPFTKWFKGGDFERGKVLGGMRAISQVNTIEGTFTNFNLWYGVPSGIDALLSSLSVKGISQKQVAQELYEHSPVFRDIVNKAMMGLYGADFDAAWGYFPESKRPKSFDDVETWAADCIDRGATEPRKFLAMLQIRHRNAIKYFKEFGIDLSPSMKEEIDVRKQESFFARHFMARINRLIIFEGEKVDAIYPEIDQGLFARLMGAVYTTFTEYRTPSREHADPLVFRDLTKSI